MIRSGKQARPVVVMCLKSSAYLLDTYYNRCFHLTLMLSNRTIYTDTYKVTVLSGILLLLLVKS